jgi:hypothetical protein
MASGPLVFSLPMNGNHVKFLILFFRSRQGQFPELLQQRFHFK